MLSTVIFLGRKKFKEPQFKINFFFHYNFVTKIIYSVLNQVFAYIFFDFATVED